MGCVAGGRVHDSAVPMEPRRAPLARNASSQSSSSSLSSRPPCLGLQCYLHPTGRFSTFPGNFSFVPPFPSRNSYPPAAGSCFTYRVHSEALRGAATEGTGVCVVRRSWVRLQPCALFDLCAEASPCGDGESGRGSQVPQPARSGRLGVQRFGAQTRWVFCGAGRRRRDRT